WLGYGFRPTLLVDSLIRLWSYAAAVGKHDAILWTECDSIFLGPVPTYFGKEFFHADIVGRCPAEWNCGNGPFVHPPFLMTVDLAAVWCNAAALLSTEVGNGSPDAFVPIACAAAGIELMQLPMVWSCNGLDMRLTSKMRDARRARESGCWHI